MNKVSRSFVKISPSLFIDSSKTECYNRTDFLKEYDITTIPIRIKEYNKAEDTLRVEINGILLDKDIDYTIDAEGKNIIAKGDIKWNQNGQGVTVKFTVLKEILDLKGGEKIPGPQGPKGDKGDKGDQGPRGPQGIEGKQGPRGFNGVQGPRGEQGIQGPQGEKGEKGDVGPQGPRGLQGEIGPQGPQGEQGIQGLQGVQGEKGEKGDIGPQGPQGEQGIQGPQGEAGPVGPQGIQGEKGEIGIPGIAGKGIKIRRNGDNIEWMYEQEVSPNINLSKDTTIYLNPNDILKTINLYNLPTGTKYVQIKTITVFGANSEGALLVNANPSITTAPAGTKFEYFGKLDPMTGPIAISGNKFEADMNLATVINESVIDFQKTHPEVVKVPRIFVWIYALNKDKVEITNMKLKLYINDTSNEWKTLFNLDEMGYVKTSQLQESISEINRRLEALESR